MIATPALYSSPHRIATLALKDSHVIRRKPEIEQERQVALGDLLRDNHFALHGADDGAYDVTLSMVENRLICDIVGASGAAHEAIKLSILPFRSIIRDYFMICETYFDAIATADPYKLEAMDMGRRSIHNEGAELLQRLLNERVAVDFDTARRLFTLICVLHIR
jgi:uncharacterized protein (UPF0262 family)